MRYRTIYADPPWNESGGGRIRRGADRHYPLMKTDEIAALPIRELGEDDSHLYLWVTNGHLPDGLKVMEAWGYRYVTNIAWAKDRFGLGQYFRGQHELCLFGVRGRLPYRTNPETGKRAQGRTLITAPRLEHSQKPEEMRQMIQVVSPGPYVELFARRTTPGWDVWGDEVDGIELPKWCERCKVWHEGGPKRDHFEEASCTLAQQISDDVDRDILEQLVYEMTDNGREFFVREVPAREYCTKHGHNGDPCKRCGSTIATEPYKCAGHDLGCRTLITEGTFCSTCQTEYREDPDAFK